MISGLHSGFYYAFEDGRINIYAASGLGSVLKSYEVCNTNADDIHTVAWGRIDLDLEELHRRDRELNL